MKSSGKTLPSLTRQIFLKPHSANHTLMRKTLFAAVALAPLWLLASQTPAAAQTTISSSIGTPQTTAADGDITIGSGGTIQPTSPGTAAVTLNSNNSVTNSGSISYSGVNSVVGILVLGGNGTAAAPLTVNNIGTITVGESFTPPDSNSDGVTEAPYASPTSAGRYGIQLTGTSAFVGDILNTGSIIVKGDNSYGVSLDAPLQGYLTQAGTITLTGDNSTALQEKGGISGNVSITGAISATGQNSLAANLAGNIGGSLDIYSAITSTGYGLTTRTTASSTLATIQNTASEIEQSGGGVIVGGSVAGGVFLGAPPANTNTSDVTTDRDGDGLVDSGEATGSITNYGKAAALTVGSATQNITLGGFNAVGAYATGNANNGYGLIIEGTVSGQGVYDGVTSSALQIGGVENVTTANGVTTTTAGGTTDLTNGLRITGSVTALSYAASANAILIGSGATVRTIDNDGTISATILAPSTTTSAFPAYGSTASPVVATAVQINAGANPATTTSLINTGSISANVTGDANDIVSTVAVSDKSGALSTISNTGEISATFTADALGATVNGTPITLANGTKSLNGNVALDLSANTSGVSLTQAQAPDIVVTTVTTNGVPIVTTTTGATAVGVASTAAATSTTVTNGNTTTVTTTTVAPVIFGDVYLGSGTNTVNLLAGTETGALGLGSGANSSFTIDNGAIYSGALTYTGQGLTLTVNNGTLDNRSASTYNTSKLTVGASGQLYFAVDPANNAASTFNVSGAASFATGSKLGLTFISNATQAETFTVVTAAGGLSVGETTTALTGAVPYMFNAAFTPNIAAGTIALEISPKTAAQLGLSSNVSAGLAPVYQALTQDTAVQAVFLNQYTKAGFVAAYNQILPDYAGGAFQAANAASLAISRATADANNIENPAGSRGAWAQEITIGVNQGAGKTDGFQGGGFGFVGGVETGGSGLGAFGLTAAFINTSTGDQHLPGDNQTALSELEVGTYWQGDFNGLVADARVGAGYTWMAGRREFVQTDSTTGDITLDRKVKSDWNGYTLSGHFGLAYDWKLSDRLLGGGWFLQPQVHADYFRMNESAYNENEAAGGPALALAISSRTGQEESGTASIVIGRKIGTGIVWRPQIELGVRDVFGGDAGDTTARFLSGGSAFTLDPADIQGAAGIARFKLKASSEYYEFGVEAGGEILSSRYEEGDVKASIRVLF